MNTAQVDSLLARWSRSARSGLLIPLLAAGCLLPTVPATDDVSAPAQPASLRVMTFNIRYGTANDGENRWPNRRELVARTIREFAPDLLGMQEVLAFQAKFLQQQLPGYGFHGAGRDDGVEAGEFSPVMWRTARFERVDAGHFWLSETPDIPGSKSWDSSLPRMVSWVWLRDRKAGGREFIYANTHWDHRGKKARLESARLIRQRAAEVLPDLPVILTGDFNTTEDLPPYALLVKGEGASDGVILRDAYRVVHPQRIAEESTFNGWKPVLAGRRIDWILCSPPFRPVWSQINRAREGDRLPSDHYPVGAVLRWE